MRSTDMNPKFEKLRESWMDFDEFKARFQKVEVEEYPNNVLKAVPKPDISVQITTYQHEPYIREAIESVLMQKVDVPWEIIIGDDESTDGTREICIEYAKKYPDLIRLFLHKRENNISVLGKPCGIFQIVYNTFNLRGRYISVLSGDDYWEKDTKLTAKYNFLEDHKKYSMVHIPVKYRKLNQQNEYEITKAFKSYPYPCCIMCRNVFKNLPVEMLSSINEDEFFKAIYLQYGRIGKIINAGYSIMNHTGNNLWANNKENKKDHMLNTSKLLYNIFGSIDHRFKRNYTNNTVRYSKKPFKDVLSKSDIWLVWYFLFYYVQK